MTRGVSRAASPGRTVASGEPPRADARAFVAMLDGIGGAVLEVTLIPGAEAAARRERHGGNARMLQARWLRRFGGRIALLAFWLQLGLSFGHIHPSDIYRFGHPVAASHGLSELAVVPMRGPATPIPAFPDTTIDVTCAICIATALTASAVPSEPPRLSPLVASGRAPPARDIAFVLVPRPFLSFQTRAPPAA